MKYHVVTFGCQMNVADSNEMSARLEARGMASTPEIEEADLVLINTCTVRQQAENRALSLLGRLKEWKKAREGRLIVLTGCAAERIKNEVSWRIPQVDLTVGAKDIERFGERLDELLGERFDWVSETEEAFDSKVVGSGDPISYVTIMRGCNYTCSYCIVPSVRGKEVYRPPETILAEVRAGVETGAKEVLLLGQTVNSYSYNDRGFAELLQQVDAVPGLQRIRYMSPHPHYMDRPTIERMAGLSTVCEHVHLPVQSGSDRLLKEMRRNYTRAWYLEAVNYLRKKIPGVSITTDVIVGFPGETEKDFEQTLGLVEEAGFDSAYCFKYSPRPGTRAAALADDVPTPLKEERLARVFEKMEAQSRRNAQKLIGTKQEILVEETGEGGTKWVVGRTRGNWKVKVALPGRAPVKPGDLVKTKITSADGRAVLGEAIAS